MAESRKIVLLLAASLSTALAGCMAATGEGDGEEREDLSAVAAPADAEESVGEASAAHECCHHCPPGTTYVAVVNTCVTEPARFDYTPWAQGCPHGAILTGRGNVICLPCGNSGPPVAIGGGLPGPQPGAFPPPAAIGGGFPGPQLGAFPPPATGIGAPGSPVPFGPFP